MSDAASPTTRTTALVTGASMGIGFELARRFAMHGHNLILVGRHRDTLEAIAEALEREHGCSTHVVVADLSNPDAPQALFDEIRDARVHVDFLINNAGFGLVGEFSDTDVTRELDMVQVNIAALTHLTKLFLPEMLKRRAGRVMQVASTAAFQPGPLAAVYFASKAYVLSFSQALSEELRGSGVTVTALCPGLTATNFAATAGISNSRLLAQVGAASASDVARHGYHAMMRGDRIAITSLRDRIMVQAVRLAPRAVVARVVHVIHSGVRSTTTGGPGKSQGSHKPTSAT